MAGINLSETGKSSNSKGNRHVFIYTYRMPTELKTRLDNAAKKASEEQGRRVTVNEVLSAIVAKHFDCPEHGTIVRGTPGRAAGGHNRQAETASA